MKPDGFCTKHMGEDNDLMQILARSNIGTERLVHKQQKKKGENTMKTNKQV